MRRATQQLHQHRLGLVVLGVRGQDGVGPESAGGAGQEVVAEASGGVLEVPALLPGDAGHLYADAVVGRLECFAQGFDEPRVFG